MAQPKTKLETSAEAATDAAVESVAKADVPAAAMEAAAESSATMDVPEAVREFAEKGAAEAKDAYTKLKANAEENSEMVESAYATASKGVSILGLKALETARVNTNAAFDHAVALLGVRSLSDAIELNSTFVRKQTEAVTLQSKEFGELTQRVVGEAVAPVKERFEKAFKSAA